MIDFKELIADREIINQIDWDITPQEAFEAYQIKSPGNIRYRSLPDVLYFSIAVFQGQAEVFLIKRSLKHSEQICLIPVPEDLTAACVARQGGDQAPQGQYAIDDPIRQWLHEKFER